MDNIGRPTSDLFLQGILHTTTVECGTRMDLVNGSFERKAAEYVMHTFCSLENTFEFTLRT